MPSSQEHCLICPFDAVEPTGDEVVESVETVAVSAYLFDETRLRDPHGVSPVAAEQGLSDARNRAAKACAACIFAGNCLDYEYRRNPVSLIHEVTPRNP